VFLIIGQRDVAQTCVFTFRHQAELVLQHLVLSPEESHLIGQLTLLLVTVDEDVGGC